MAPRTWGGAQSSMLLQSWSTFGSTAADIREPAELQFRAWRSIVNEVRGHRAAEAN
jgi:hypothetical protein